MKITNHYNSTIRHYIILTLWQHNDYNDYDDDDFIVMVVGGPWMLNQIVTYTQQLWQGIPGIVS